MKITFVIYSFLFALLSLSTADASPGWTVNKELTIPSKSTQVAVMSVPSGEEKNLLQKATCDLIVSPKNYERTLKLDSEFSLISISVVPLPEPNLEELKRDLKKLFGVDADNVKTVDELRQLVKQLNITMVDNTNSTNFELRLRSVKSQNDYTMKCSINTAGASAADLEDLLVNFGAISPAKEL